MDGYRSFDKSTELKWQVTNQTLARHSFCILKQGKMCLRGGMSRKVSHKDPWAPFTEILIKLIKIAMPFWNHTSGILQGFKLGTFLEKWTKKPCQTSLHKKFLTLSWSKKKTKKTILPIYKVAETWSSPDYGTGDKSGEKELDIKTCSAPLNQSHFSHRLPPFIKQQNSS